MKKLISCEFNIDTACVELRFTDGGLISIDCTAVEDEIAHTIRQRSELDWLIYNDPVGYADLVLKGDPVAYLKSVTEQLGRRLPVLLLVAFFCKRQHNFVPYLSILKE